ncbi:lisH domain-containing protein ARMC9-like isoform X2 [Periplaneta americana]
MDQLESENLQKSDIPNPGKDDVLLPDLTRYEEAEKLCLQLISEFLQSYELASTLEAFTADCSELAYEVPESVKKERVRKDSLLKILDHFAKNDLANFFSAWEQLVPASIQEKLEYKKLTFYLHVHFAVLPLRKQQDSAEEEDGDKAGMEVLRGFLETKGTQFSAEPEFLPFYALPFVSNPATHPSFQELFTEDWACRLAGSLRNFVVGHCWGAGVAPRLLQLSLVDGVHKSHSQLLEAHKNYKQLKRRYQKLHRDHHNLIGIAAELTGALESSVKGQAVDLKATLHNCTQIFPDLFRQAPQTETASDEVIWQSFSEQTMPGLELDFRKIKQHLATASVKTKLLLFQALRWRITRSSPEDRDAVVSAYCRHDVLGLQYSAPLPLAAHLCPLDAATPHPLQQAAARLINTLASLRCGRDYLSSPGTELLRVLVPCLRGDAGTHLDSTTADMLLATLQKLSLRHSQRIGMIELGLVEWLVQRLSADAVVMKPYTLEYSAALLMNLCLHRRAKERCVPLAHTVLQLLTGLLGTDVAQAVPYVNGTLYSLLAHPQLNAEARRMGLCSMLELYLKHSEGEMAKQLEYILRLHRGDCQPDHSATSDEENADDDAEEVDLLEEELDSDDPVRSLHGELSGDQLLLQNYRLVFPHHGVVHPSSSSTGDLLLRPTTPRLLSLGSLEGKRKCSSTVVRPATSPELRHSDESSDANSCLRACDNLVLESLDKDDDDDEKEAVMCGAEGLQEAALLSSTDSSSDAVAVEAPPVPPAASEEG